MQVQSSGIRGQQLAETQKQNCKCSDKAYFTFFNKVNSIFAGHKVATCIGAVAGGILGIPEYAHQTLSLELMDCANTSVNSRGHDYCEVVNTLAGLTVGMGAVVLGATVGSTTCVLLAEGISALGKKVSGYARSSRERNNPAHSVGHQQSALPSKLNPECKTDKGLAIPGEYTSVVLYK